MRTQWRRPRSMHPVRMRARSMRQMSGPPRRRRGRRPWCRSIPAPMRASGRRGAESGRTMPRTQKVLRSGDRGPGEIIDTLLLKFEDRVKQQGFVFGGKGTCIEFDFPDPPLLRTDDLLVLDDGRLVEVVADVEQVLEVREKDFAKAARLLL